MIAKAANLNLMRSKGFKAHTIFNLLIQIATISVAIAQDTDEVNRLLEQEIDGTPALRDSDFPAQTEPLPLTSPDNFQRLGIQEGDITTEPPESSSIATPQDPATPETFFSDDDFTQ